MTIILFAFNNCKFNKQRGGGGGGIYKSIEKQHSYLMVTTHGISMKRIELMVYIFMIVKMLKSNKNVLTHSNGSLTIVLWSKYSKRILVGRFPLAVCEATSTFSNSAIVEIIYLNYLTVTI